MKTRVQGMSGHDEQHSRLPGEFRQQIAPGVHVTYEADRIVDRVRNGAGESLVIDNAHFGRLLMVDGALRSSSADEFIHHEMMSHLPLLAHGRAERVLIVGGADFGLAEEVLKHRGVRKLVQVEADHLTSKLARTYLAGINAPVFEDDRFELRTVDGPEFLATRQEHFDVILVDMPEPVGMRGSALTQQFFRDARGCLTSGGLLITRLGAPFLQPLAFSVAMKRLAAAFPVISAYLVPVPSRVGGPVAMGWASNVLRPDAPALEVLAERFAEAYIGTHYYTPEVHRASFAIPQYLKNAISAATRPDEEERVVTSEFLQTIDTRRAEPCNQNTRSKTSSRLA
jgi:spermidine synthase